MFLRFVVLGLIVLITSRWQGIIGGSVWKLLFIIAPTEVFMGNGANATTPATVDGDHYSLLPLSTVGEENCQNKASLHSLWYCLHY